MPARARLVDVAARARVSSATASLVLRGRPGPSAATRSAVERAAEELGYRADRTASLLARHRTHLLGVLLDVTNPFHAEVVGALDEAAGEHGLDLVLSTVTARHDEPSAVETLVDFRCEGLVLLGPELSEAALDAIATGVPTVVVGRAGTEHAHGVRASDDLGLAAAVDHLVGLGHRTVTFVDGPRGSIAAARRRGFRAAMSRHGLSAGATVLAGGATEADGLRAAAGLLATASPERPTAVVAFNDRSAIGIRDALLRSGLDVPGDISVVGYDDSPLARMATVDLTTVSQDPTGLALATVAALVARLDGGGDATARQDVVITPRLVVRGTTAPPPVGR